MSFFLAVVRRTLSTLVTLFGVSIIIFVVLRLLPGNAVTAAMGVSEGLLTKAQVAALDRYYGVGQPVIQQYCRGCTRCFRATWASHWPRANP